MKKIYNTPEMKSVAIKIENLLNSVSGDDLNMRINNSDASHDAESRGGISWDDED